MISAIPAGSCFDSAKSSAITRLSRRPARFLCRSSTSVAALCGAVRSDHMRQIVILVVTSLAGLTVAGNLIAQYRDEWPAVNIIPRSGTRGAPTEDAARTANIRVDTTLVPIPVAVTDPLSPFATRLEKEDLRLYEDKGEQPIAQFSSPAAP